MICQFLACREMSSKISNLLFRENKPWTIGPLFEKPSVSHKNCFVYLPYLPDIVWQKRVSFLKSNCGDDSIFPHYSSIVFRNCSTQWRIQLITFGEVNSVTFGSQCHNGFVTVRGEVYFTTLLWQNNGQHNGLTSRTMGCSEHDERLIPNWFWYVAFQIAQNHGE